MSQSQKMKQAIIANVVPNLIQEGFCGEYPHFRRVHADRIDIVSFASYKYGNAIFIDISTAYLRDEKNNVTNRFDGNFDTITTSDCSKIYRLKGNFGNLFYYTDVYFRLGMVEGIGENRKDFKRKPTGILLQKADENIYGKVCDLINKRMKKAYKWFDKMSKK